MRPYTQDQWVLLFFLYSVLGWVWESCYVSLKSRQWVNRGFLHGPWLPIYGSGAIVILLLTLPARGRPARIFLLGMVGATVLEYVTGAVMERLFHMRYWDYADKPLNVNGHICLPVSICWGILSMRAVRDVQPVLEGYAALLPEWAAALAVFLVTPDGILTARVLLTTHDIDALTPQTLLRSKRRRTA